MVRGAAHRFASAGLVLTAIVLLILGKADEPAMERFRGTLNDTVAPALNAMTSPIETLTGTIGGLRDWAMLHEDNARLRAERERMLKWQAVALRLEAENEALRKLLNLVPEPEAEYVTARIVADSGGTFAHSRLLNGGAEQNIGIGDAVVTSEGLAGRIVGVARQSSRLLLITDLNSRIPVAVAPGGVHAILAGDNTEFPRLVHTGPDVPIAPGDRVVTSGDGSALPPGLPVGVVASTADGRITVKPFVDQSRLTYVQVADFGLSGILGSKPAPARPADDSGALADARAVKSTAGR